MEEFVVGQFEQTIPILCGVKYEKSIPINSAVYQLIPNIEEKIRNTINQKELYQSLQLLISENPLNISKLSNDFSSELIEKLKTASEADAITIVGLLDHFLRIRLTTKDLIHLIHLYISMDKYNIEILNLLNSLARFGGPERYYAFPGFLTCLYKNIVIGNNENWGISLTFRSRGNGVIFSILSQSINITATIKEGFLVIESGINLPLLVNSPNKGDKQMNNKRIVNGKWYTLTINHSKREQRVVIEIEKETFTFTLNYPRNETACLSIGGIAGNSKSYFIGDVTDVVLFPEEILLSYQNNYSLKEVDLFDCYKISDFAPIITIVRETAGGIINRIGGISKLIVLLNQQHNKRALIDCERILDFYFRLLSTFKMLRQDSIDNDIISTIFQTLIKLAESTKDLSFGDEKKPHTPIVKEFISFALRLINSHPFASIRNLVLRHLFDVRWWTSDKLRVDYVKELMISVNGDAIDTLPFKLFEKLSYRSLMLWILYDELPEFEKETIPRPHLQWRCAYIQYVTSIILKDIYIVQYFMTDSLHLLDSAIQVNDFRTQALLIYMYVCMILTSKGNLKVFIVAMLKKNKPILLFLYIQNNPSFLKGNIERLISLLGIDVKYDVIVKAMNSTRLTPLLYQIAIESSFNIIRNTFVDTTSTGYLSSKGFILNMSQIKLKQDFITPFLHSLSVSVANNLINNMVVLDIVLNDLIQCMEEHVIWKCLIQTNNWITIFIDMAVSLVNVKEFTILQQLQNIFARLIGIAFQQQNVSLENIICYLLSKLQNKERFYIIFRSLLKCLVNNVLAQLNEESRDRMVVQMILLFSDFFCRTCSYGCDKELPHFEEDFELVTKCLEYHYPQPKPCDSKVSSMQHVFIVHLILCQLHSIALKNNDIQLLRKTLQLIPPYLVQRPQFEGYDSWVIFHLSDIVKQCNDPSVRRDIANMMYLLNQQRQIPQLLDFKGIQSFGKDLVSFYKTHENGLKVQADVLKIEETKTKSNIQFLFKEVQYPNLDVAPMDFMRLLMSDTDIRLRAFTATNKNWLGAIKSNPFVKINGHGNIEIEEVGFSEVRPIITMKQSTTEENEINIIDYSDFDKEFNELTINNNGLIKFKTIPNEDGVDGIIICPSSKELTKIYINADNLQLIFKTPSQINEFSLNIVTMVVLRKESYIEFYIKYHRPILVHIKDSMKFISSLSHVAENHQIPTVIYNEPIKSFGQSTIIKDWVNGITSNYMLLNQINFFGGYSYNDINNHPIFPWIDSSINWETMLCHVVERSKQNLLRKEFSFIPSPPPELRNSRRMEAIDVCCLLFSVTPYNVLLPFYQAQLMRGKAIRSFGQISECALIPEVYSYPIISSLDRMYIMRMSLELNLLSKSLHNWIVNTFPFVSDLPQKKYYYDFEGIFLNKECTKIDVLPINNGSAITIAEEGFSFKSSYPNFTEVNIYMKNGKMKRVDGLNVTNAIYDGNEITVIEMVNGKTTIKQKGNLIDLNGLILDMVDSKKGTIEYVTKNSTGVEWKYCSNGHQLSILKIEEIEPIQKAFISSKKCLILFTKKSFCCKTLGGSILYTNNFIPTLFTLSANGFSYYVHNNLLQVDTLNDVHVEIPIDSNYISMTATTCLFLDFIILAKPNELSTYVFLGDRFVFLGTVPFIEGWTVTNILSNKLINDDPSNWNFIVNCEKEGIKSFAVYDLQYVNVKLV